MSQIMDVIVVGCGASGLAALRRLHDAGLKVTGLEAANRIGGRIHSVEFGSAIIDLGAAWCHGERDNIVYNFAHPHGLLGTPEPSYNHYVLSNGDLVPNVTGEELVNILNDELGKCEKNNTKGITEFLSEISKSNPVLKKNPGLTSMVIDWFKRNSHVGGQNEPRDGKSLKGLEEYWNCDGEFLLNWKGKGYKMILDILLNKYPDPTKEVPVKVILNKEVDSIKWSSQPGFDSSNPLVQINCKDGSLHAAKSVIVTFSIGVLKERYKKLFSPPLPIDKVNSIKNLQFCILDKIYIEFEKPWWSKSNATFNLLWRKQDLEKFSSEEKWITEIFGLWSIDYEPNVLLAWIYGNGAKEMEKVDLNGIRQGIEKLLELVFKKQFDVTPVKSILRSQWATNSFYRGAYSYRSVATEENGGGAISLSVPLYHGNKFPIVCFAGEATSHHHHSAVHGAVESGFREADRLIEVFKNETK